MALGRTKDMKIELLQKVPLFSACSKKELGRIASLAETLDVKQGDLLTKEGATGSEAFVIAQGEAVASIGEHQLAVLGPGAVVGEMALLDHGPRSATVTAASDMVVLVLGRPQFSALVDETPSVARKVMVSLAQRLRAVESTKF